MRRAILWAAALLLVTAAGARASDPIGIYALIDRVVFEPSETRPERVRVWGAFVKVRDQGFQYTAPARGYMYFALPTGKEDQARKEWADLKRMAGTGVVVGFGTPGGAKGLVRTAVPKHEAAPAATAEQIAKLIADLDNDKFAVRERASQQLARLGEQAQPALRKALEGKVSTEARRRIEQLLQTEKPDSYPLGFGLIRLDRNAGHPIVKDLQSLPAPVSPADGAQVGPGKVTLRTHNILCAERKNAKYVFEIEGPSGARETSQPVDRGEKDTEWTPALEVKAGQKYTWRVWAVDGSWKGPAATATFTGKSAR